MRRFVAAMVALLADGSTLAAIVPAAGAVDPRVRELVYEPDQVVRLTGYVGYHIDLQLENGERFVALGAGDSAALDVASEGAHVLLKPKAASVATNLTLVSSRRVYHFEYRTIEAPPPLNTAIFALRFRYPVAPSESTPAATPGLADARVREPPRPLNADYWYCGSPWLQPQVVTDDGVQTRLRFSARGEWPAIFVANADGTESLLNFHAEGTTAVVHRVAPRFVLRRGRLVGCVENRGYAGSGEWLGNGALEPNDTREVQP